MLSEARRLAGVLMVRLGSPGPHPLAAADAALGSNRSGLGMRLRKACLKARCEAANLARMEARESGSALRDWLQEGRSRVDEAI